jgi:hypothetical protein
MSFRTLRPLLAFGAAALMLGLVAQGAQLSPAQAHGGHDHPAPDPAQGSAVAVAAGADVTELNQMWWEGDDVLLTGRSHSDGYTVYIAQEKEQYALRPLATIRPSGYDGDDWLGYTCLTGDRQYAVATLIPRWAVNRPELRDRGGLAYVVATATGKVWPLANEVAFKYHATNCGAGSSVALMRNLGNDQESSEVLVADAATRKVSSLGVVKGQLTSPVPATGGAVALGKGGILAVRAGGKTTVQAKVPARGVAYRLVARGQGQTVAVQTGDKVSAYAVDGAQLWLAGVGDKAGAGIFASETAVPRLIGLRAETKRGVTPSWVATPRLAETDGPDVQARELAPDAVSAEGKVVLATTTVGLNGQLTVPQASESSDTRATPTAAEKRLFSGSTGALLVGRFPEERAAAITEAVPSTVTMAPQRGLVAGDWTTPKCAVPRNEPTRTALGADDKQATWAVEQASRNSLPSRPADYLKSGLPAYSPSSDFALPSIKPNGGNVPPALFSGVLAQESAYRQASRRVLPGSGGNTIIGNYYGAGGTIDLIDYSKADCGYGIAQVTSGMATSDTSITPNGKAKIAIDYAENIQAGMNILVKKWNQLQDAGIKINDSNPAQVENWYGALWAYNSGVQPNAKYGNTTGCTPSPTCTDAEGNWGLGWSNNPRNPDYPPNRSVFLRSTYADAEHPSDWPYQERVIGWAETPIKNYKGENAYQPAIRGTALPYPAINTFCTTANRCNPATTEGCTHPEYRCWWHLPVTFKHCDPPAGVCTKSPFTLPVGAPEPVSTNPWAPACNSELGSKAIIVDELNDPSKNIFCPNRNWTTNGTFSYTVGKTAEGAPLGVIDFHQSATGFGAHAYFAGNRVGTDTAHNVNGQWKPNNLTAGSYLIKAHIPRAGASVGSAVYRVRAADGAWHEKVVNQHEHYNHWKSLGVYQLNSAAAVELSNVTKYDTSGNVGTVAWDAMAFIPVTGTYKEKTVSAVSYFDGNQDITVGSAMAKELAGPMGGPNEAYDWGEPLARSLSIEGGPQVRVAGARLLNEVKKAKESPDVDDDGISVASWLGLSDPYLQRPISTQKPAWFDQDDRSYKIRSQARVSYVLGTDGKIVVGSADVEYQHRTGTTYLPRFILEMFAAIQQDYGVPAPDLRYTAENLNLADHQIVEADPGADGGMPGRAHKPAGADALVTGPTGWPDPTGGTCVNTLYVSGGTIGYRAMLGTGYITPRVAAWMQQVRAKPNVPASVKKYVLDVEHYWFHNLPPTGGGPLGSPYTQAPPIWQELQFQVCADGTVRPSPMFGNSGILRTSWMPNSYLWLDGKSINLGGSLQTTVAPVLVGDFQSFSRLPGPGPGAYGSCKSDSGRNGNPWNIQALTSPVDINPDKTHFCVDENRESDPEPGG